MFPSPPLPYYPIDLFIPFKLKFVKDFLVWSFERWEPVLDSQTSWALGEEECWHDSHPNEMVCLLSTDLLYCRKEFDHAFHVVISKGTAKEIHRLTQAGERSVRIGRSFIPVDA
jgi:hypothetical protein